MTKKTIKFILEVAKYVIGAVIGFLGASCTPDVFNF